MMAGVEKAVDSQAGGQNLDAAAENSNNIPYTHTQTQSQRYANKSNIMILSKRVLFGDLVQNDATSVFSDLCTAFCCFASRFLFIYIYLERVHILKHVGC